MDKLIEEIKKYIEEQKQLDSIDIDYMYKVVDILKDLEEVKNMNNGYGRYGNYGEYGEYGRENYGRRGVDSKYRASKYMDGMRGSYEAYEDARSEYNNGNYGAKEDGLKELEYMMHAAMKFIKMVKEEATSPEEQEIVRKHIMKISEM